MTASATAPRHPTTFTPAGHAFARTISRRRFTPKLFKHPVELRKRVESRGNRDFADAQVAVI